MKKAAIIIVIIVAVLEIFALLVSFYVTQSTKNSILEPEDIDYCQWAMVLGARVIKDKPSLMLKDRLDCAFELYSLGKCKKILLSGDGSSETENEPLVMKEYLVEKGVPEEDILCDEKGFSTCESVFRLKDEFGIENVIVVTQRYHLYRALFLCRAKGIKAVGAGGIYDIYYGRSKRRVRELLAQNKDFLVTLTIKEDAK